MIDTATATAYAEFLSNRPDRTFVLALPESPVVETLRLGLEWVAALNPISKEAAQLLLSFFDAHPITLPAPWGPTVLVPKNVLADATLYACTIIREAQHAEQIRAVGSAQALQDFTDSELRAQREAEAREPALWLRYMLTGVLPEEKDVATLEDTLYHISANQKEFARQHVLSVRATLEEGLVPPFRVCLDTLAWFRAHHPTAIVAEAYRNA
jgi:hypothetical protein